MLNHPIRLFAILAAGLIACARVEAEGSTVAITVNVPPIAEALSAADQGAAGAWTVASGDGGLLIGAEQSASGAPSGLTVFRSDRNRFQLRPADRPDAPALEPYSVEPGRSLVRLRFDLDSEAGSVINREMRIILSAT